ncbi:MAG: hypothetical protein U5L04_07125 [Trueperaceae bacterium]|nr:hypothetical protein [Trueperaceae bacterium]
MAVKTSTISIVSERLTGVDDTRVCHDMPSIHFSHTMEVLPAPGASQRVVWSLLKLVTQTSGGWLPSM